MPPTYPALRQFLLAHCGIPESIIEATLRRYAEPQRHYHTVEHLARMVMAVESHAIALTQAQTLALLFHDAVYVPGAQGGKNEQESCLLLRSLAREHVEPDTLDITARIILDTIHHIPTQAPSSVVLDLDLLGLAGPIAEVFRDGDLIFKENAHLVVDWDDYSARRSRFLQGLLDRPQILYSTQLRHHEDTLRQNLRDVIRARNQAQ